MKLNEIKSTEALPPEYQEALDAYAEAKGRSWKRKLADDWATGKDERFPKYGSMLRAIRNHPDWSKIIYKAIR